jgi:hypothetical protein
MKKPDTTLVSKIILLNVARRQAGITSRKVWHHVIPGLHLADIDARLAYAKIRLAARLELL